MAEKTKEEIIEGKVTIACFSFLKILGLDKNAWNEDTEIKSKIKKALRDFAETLLKIK